MELELRRLEDLAESIVNDFAYMRAREEEMRDTNGEFALCKDVGNLEDHDLHSPELDYCVISARC